MGSEASTTKHSDGHRCCRGGGGGGNSGSSPYDARSPPTSNTVRNYRVAIDAADTALQKPPLAPHFVAPDIGPPSAAVDGDVGLRSHSKTDVRSSSSQAEMSTDSAPESIAVPDVDDGDEARCCCCCRRWAVVEIHSLNIAELLKIRRLRVVRAEVYWRDIQGKSELFSDYGWVHKGVVVTVEKRHGARFLIHKLRGERWQPNDGRPAGPAVRTATASAMIVVEPFELVDKNAWQPFEPRQVKRIRRATIGAYIEVCGFEYNLLVNNCLHAANRMMKLD